MNLFIDSTAQIQDGEKDVTESFPSTWKDFISHSYWSKVLREFLHIVRNYEVPQHYKNLYEIVYKRFIEGEYIVSIRCPYKDVKFCKFKSQNNYSNDFSDISDGLLMEACFHFAMFFLCREFAKISGCTKNYTYPLNLKEVEFNNIFSHERRSDPQTSNRLFNRYVRVIKNKLNEDRNYKQSKLEKIAEAFNPTETNNDFRNQMEKIFSTDKMSNVISVIKEENSKILNKVAKSFFKCITNDNIESSNFNTQIYASGDGSESTGFLGMLNLGIFIFPYSNENIEDDSIVNKDNVVHLYAWGFNSCLFSKIEVTIASTTWNFNGSKNIFNSIRPERNGQTEPNSYRTPRDFNDSIGETIEDLSETSLVEGGFKFNRNMNDLSFNDDFQGGTMSMKLISGDLEDHSEKDEFFLIANVANNKIILENGNQIKLVFENLFDDDMFEVKSAKRNSFFEMHEDFLEEVITFIHTNNPYINTKIEGWYIGTYDYLEVSADKSNIPIPSFNKERSKKQKGDGTIRYSKAIIQLDRDNNKIDIEIWSTTSPLRSNLKNNINKYKQTTADVNIDFYTNIDKYKVAFYNQPLAMLRSMGVLEAIAKEFCLRDQSDLMKDKMTKMLRNAESKDKSGKQRGNDHADYQLENTISYATYKSFKWYKNDADYNQYDHLINFDTTENNNN